MQYMENSTGYNYVSWKLRVFILASYYTFDHKIMAGMQWRRGSNGSNLYPVSATFYFPRFLIMILPLSGLSSIISPIGLWVGGPRVMRDCFVSGYILFLCCTELFRVHMIAQWWKGPFARRLSITVRSCHKFTYIFKFHKFLYIKKWRQLRVTMNWYFCIS